MVTFLRNTLLSVSLLLLPACASLETMLYGAGGAAAGSLAGPGGAAAGAVVGIGAAELQQADRAQEDIKAQIIPKTPWESFIDSTGNLLHTLGWWYLVLFIFVPLITKRGRSWAKNFITLSDTATKKDVDDYSKRLNKLEGMISSSMDHEQ